MRRVIIGFGLVLSVPFFILAPCFNPTNVTPENLTGEKTGMLSVCNIFV